MNVSRLGWLAGACVGMLAAHYKHLDPFGYLLCVYVAGYFLSSLFDFIFSSDDEVTVSMD